MTTPSDWGPPLWYQMHMKTFNYDGDRKEIVRYFNGITYLLPCDKCKKHYIDYLKAKPVHYYLDNRDDLIHWLIDLHNEVNARNGKKIWSYSEARSLYEKKENKNNLFYIVLLLIIIIIITIVKNKK